VKMRPAPISSVDMIVPAKRAIREMVFVVMM
jgi:hypothetical protein